MKKIVFPLILAGAVALGSARASAAELPSLAVLLSDAQYALNRFQELDTEATCDEAHTPDSHAREVCADTRRMLNKQIDEVIKPGILRAGKARSPKASDLLDIYAVLEEASMPLSDLSSYDTVTDKEREQYQAAAGKTSQLAVGLYGQTLLRIVALEEHTCAR